MTTLQAELRITRQFRSALAAMIYAFKRTGSIVNEKNKHLLAAQELREWDEAIDEYQRRVESGDVI